MSKINSEVAFVSGFRYNEAVIGWEVFQGFSSKRGRPWCLFLVIFKFFKGGDNVSILTKAMELGQEIANSPELKSKRDAEAAVLADPSAADMIREFQTKQRAMAEAQSSGRQLTNEEQEAMVELHRRMTENPKVEVFLESQRQFQRIINDINQILHQAVTGNTCTPSG
jgi:cell fate (sporulation/competence/biofilm development) regulator YlbF (YheA/YmcA/DUF963 family)